MKILITDGCGFVGTNISLFLKKKNHKNKYKFNYKLKNLDNELLPEFLRLNKTLYKDWFN